MFHKTFRYINYLIFDLCLHVFNPNNKLYLIGKKFEVSKYIWDFMSIVREIIIDCKYHKETMIYHFYPISLIFS